MGCWLASGAGLILVDGGFGEGPAAGLVGANDEGRVVRDAAEVEA